MKIEHKILFSNIFHLSLIVLIGIFAIQNMDLVLAKFRFIEIADDLNVSFLEMRLSEKNYFLYKDVGTLVEIEGKIGKTLDTMHLVREEITKVIGESRYNELQDDIYSYLKVVSESLEKNKTDKNTEEKIRAEGRKLEEYSDQVTKLERLHINEIIQHSKYLLEYSFLFIFVSAILISRLISKKIMNPIKEIKRQVKRVSDGNYTKLEIDVPKDEFGSVIEAINTMSEELRNHEEEMIQSKKLASIGILTAGVAHELNNPLNNISMIAQTYIEMYEKLDSGQRLEFMEKIESEAERIKLIVNNLLDFSKPKKPDLHWVDVNLLIVNALKLVQNAIDISNIETKKTFTEDIPKVYIDENQMQQVLVSLFVNAVQAMSPGGELFISTGFGQDYESVEINIKDTGKGIPAEYLSHIFDPFFSTKNEGGTGLGLSVSYGIIKNLGGSIKVESSVGVGTAFTIILPISRKIGED
jgi:two-component system NtrC family sensor kinase